MENLPGKYCGALCRFNKIPDDRQNPMSLSRAGTASWICFMIGSKEEPYPGRVLISFWCDYDNKNLYFRISADNSILLILLITKIL